MLYMLNIGFSIWDDTILTIFLINFNFNIAHLKL